MRTSESRLTGGEYITNIVTCADAIYQRGLYKEGRETDLGEYLKGYVSKNHISDSETFIRDVREYYPMEIGLRKFAKRAHEVLTPADWKKLWKIAFSKVEKEITGAPMSSIEFSRNLASPASFRRSGPFETQPENSGRLPRRRK